MQDINEDLKAQIPFAALAKQLGATEQEVEQATELALPALLAGMNANAHQSSARAESLIAALIKDHNGQVLDADDPIQRVDRTDGEKVVNHVFGSNADAVSDRLGIQAGQPSLMKNLLPMLAPLVMGWLSRRMGGAVQERAPQQTPSKGGGLGDILGEMLGGSGGDSGGGLGGLLGGLLGGGSNSGGGGLGGMLGEVLGGGKAPASQPAQTGPDLGGLVDILGSLAGAAGSKSGASQRMPDLSDLLGR